MMVVAPRSITCMASRVPVRACRHILGVRRASTATSTPASLAIDQQCRDEHYMRAALEQADKAACAGEVPIGAVLVVDNTIVARAHNAVEASTDATAHAEILAIRHACAQLARWRLVDATLYVTLEPCIMCAGALLQARVGTLVYGAANPLLGADGSYANLLRPPEQPPRAAEGCCGEVHGGALQPRGPHPFHPDLVVRRGVLQEPCADILRQFFRRRRAEGDGTWNE